MVKKILGMLSVISILVGPMIYLSIMNRVGQDRRTAKSEHLRQGGIGLAGGRPLEPSRYERW